MTTDLHTLRTHAAGIDTNAAKFVRDAARVEAEVGAWMSDMTDLIRHGKRLYATLAQLNEEDDR